MTVDTSLVEEGFEVELFLFSENVSNGKKWARKVMITGASGCNLSQFKDFLQEYFGLLSYHNKQNMPVEETITVFPNPDSEALWEEKIIENGIEMSYCGEFLEGSGISAIEPDLSPEF